MKQRDEDAADAVSSRQHVHGEDAVPFDEWQCLVKSLRKLISPCQSTMHRAGLDHVDSCRRSRPACATLHHDGVFEPDKAGATCRRAARTASAAPTAASARDVIEIGPSFCGYIL